MKRQMWAAMAIVVLGGVPAVAQERAALADRHRIAPNNASHTAWSTGAIGSPVSPVRAMSPVSDDAIANRIVKEILRYSRYTIFDDVNVSVDRGVATLSGRVTMPYKAKDMARLASRVKGVLEVNNDLGVLPVSIYDDRLRQSIARQIYNDPVFSRYAIHVNPPIHIIVERGNVTLTGAVNSKVERQKAEVIVRSTSGVFGVENQLRIDS
jgi:osmotically-inducible protein OsmY